MELLKREMTSTIISWSQRLSQKSVFEELINDSAVKLLASELHVNLEQPSRLANATHVLYLNLLLPKVLLFIIYLFVYSWH